MSDVERHLPDQAHASATAMTHPENGIIDGLTSVSSVMAGCVAGMCLVDAEGVILRVNDAFAMALGYEAAELAGQPLLRLHPPEIADAAAAVQAALVANRPCSEWAARELAWVHQRGRPVVGHTRNARLVGADGTVLRLITLIDLAEMARNHPRMQQLHRVENFAALAAGISNDFNNLLSIILGYTALLQDGSTDAARVKIVADGVEGAVQRASTLVRRTLYLARRPPPVLKPADLRRLVEEAVVRARAQLGDQPVELLLAPDVALRTVPVDAAQLGDALEELFVRVRAEERDASRAVKVTTRIADGELVRRRFPLAAGERFALIEFMSPGLPRNQSRSPFSGGGDATDPRVGHDLGLTMVERILDAHRGLLGVELLSGGGKVFSLYLPLTVATEDGPAPASAPATVAVTPPVGAGAATILLVDDERGLLETLAAALRRYGYEVLTAEDGETAIALLRTHGGRIKLAIIDLVLPSISGWEIFNHLRSHHAGVPALIMSGHMEPKLQSAVNRSGAAGFLQKPFSIGAFLRQVSELVGAPPGR